MPPMPEIPEGWTYVGENTYHGCHIMKRVYRGLGKYTLSVGTNRRSLYFFRSKEKHPEKIWQDDAATTETAEHHAQWHLAR